MRLTHRNHCSGTSLVQLPRPEKRRKRSGWKKAPPGLWRLRLRDRTKIHFSMGGCSTSVRAAEAQAHSLTLEPRPGTPILLEASWKRSPNQLLGFHSVHPGQDLASQIQPLHLGKWTTHLSLQPLHHPSHSVTRNCPRLTLSAPVRPRAQHPSASGSGPRVARAHLGSRSVNPSHLRPQVARSISVKARPLAPLPFHLDHRMGRSRIVRPPSISHCRSGSDLQLPLQLRTPSASRVHRPSQRHRQMPLDSVLVNNHQLRLSRQLLYHPSRSQGRHNRLVVRCST